jgi:hypothetical protein
LSSRISKGFRMPRSQSSWRFRWGRSKAASFVADGNYSVLYEYAVEMGYIAAHTGTDES